MRAHLVTVLLAACGGATAPADVTTLPVGQAGPVADATGDFVVSAIVAGQEVRFTVDGVPPSRPVWVFGSARGLGTGPCPPRMNGDCFGIAPPGHLLAKLQANASGWATGTVQAPPRIAVSSLAFQAVAFDAAGNSYLSDPITRTVGGLACPAVYMPVCGLDGTTYGNGCEADVAGMLVASSGPC